MSTEPSPTITLSPPVDACIRAALALAGERGHHRATPEHLLRTLLDAPGARALVSGVGADSEELVRDVDQYLDLLQDRPRWWSRDKGPAFDATAQRVVRQAALYVASSGGGEVGAGHLLVAFFAEEKAYATILLQAAGIGRLELLRYICHGERHATPPPACAPGHPARVLLHNDCYTTMEFVVEVLGEVFGLPEDRATALMLRVHHEGRGEAGVWPFREAEELASLATARAAEAGHPLLCTVEPEAKGRK